MLWRPVLGILRRAQARLPQRGLREGKWRRGESNPRPRNLATRRLHAYPVPMVSPEALRAGKTRRRLVR